MNRSASANDRSAYFSAQFALSHAAWLIAYPIAGQLGASLGLLTTAWIMGGAILFFTLLAGLFWPKQDEIELRHTHTTEDHQHSHSHGLHHDHVHVHEGDYGPEPHTHEHLHAPIQHKHVYVIDDHHVQWPRATV